MRIGLFTDTYPPYINGVSTSVQMLKNALEKKGHQVYVITVNNSSIKYNYDDKDHIMRIPGVPIGIYDYRLTSIYPLKIINVMKSWKLDVIHSHTEFGVGIFARIFAKQFNIPLVHTYHTMYEDYTHYITHGYFDKSSKKIVEYLTKFYCDKTASELIVPTNKTYKLFKEKYKYEKNIHIIPTGIEVDRFFSENIQNKFVLEIRKKYNFTKKDTVIVFVGRLAEEKNVEFLLNAQKKLIKENSNLKLLIIGDGPDKEKFEKISEKLRITDNVIFTGKVPWDEIQYYYHASDIFATASTSETQGLTVIEAMAANIVPLCIKDEAFISTITDDLNGYIFNDEKEYIEKVLYLVNNKKEKSRMAKQSRIQAEHCSSAQYAENVLLVYERAIKNKNEYRYGIFSKIIKKIKGE